MSSLPARGRPDLQVVASQQSLPVGTVTFLLSDIEGSTRLWESAPEAMAVAVPRHYELIAAAVEAHGGVRPVEQGEGDSVVVVFTRASDALQAAVDLQRALLAERWPDGIDLGVRVALHAADAHLRDAGNYQGIALSRCARLRAIAAGGQILLSQAVHDLVVDQLVDDVRLADLGVHGLRDLGRAERVFAVTHPDLPVVAAPKSLDARPNNLPVQLSSFIGRERELGDVSDALAQARLLTLSGAGGCGKTRLALRTAADTLDRFADGVWWVELAPLSGPDVVARELTQSLGVRPMPGSSDLDAAVFFLESRAALIVMDNCEHVLDQAAAITGALLERCPRVTVLATSREPLRVAGETEWLLPSMSLPTADTTDASLLLDADAAALFVDRAAKVRPNFRLSDANSASVVGICRGLDGIPLALELAAARVRMLSLEQIAAGLGDRFRLLTGGSRSALPRHQTLRASVEWSHDLLTDAERMLFRRLAVFAGGFTLDAAEQVCSEDVLRAEQVLDLLASLVEKSLVQADDDPHAVRYRLLETVRQYALEQLTAAGELQFARDGHRDAYLDIAERLAGETYTAAQVDVISAFDADAANLANALDWSTATDAVKALRLCVALSTWWRLSGMYDDGQAAAAGALAAGPDAPPALRARVMADRGFMLARMAAFDVAIEGSDAAFELASEADARDAMARALVAKANALIPFDHVAMGAAAERGIEIGEQSEDHFGWRWSMYMLALMHAFRDDAEPAQRVARELLADSEQCHDREMTMWATFMLAVPGYARGDHDTMRRQLADAIARARDLHDVSCDACCHYFLALVESQSGPTDAILDELHTSRTRALNAGAALALPWLELGIGVATASTGRLEQGAECLDALAALPVLTVHIRAQTAIELAEITRLMGDEHRATALARHGLELAGELPNAFFEAKVRIILGRLAASRRAWPEAERMHHVALDAICENGFRVVLPSALEALVEVAFGLESSEEAARLLGAASRVRGDLGFVAWPQQRDEVSALAACVREALGDSAFDAAFDAGAELAPDDAVAWVRRARGTRKRPAGGWESLTPTELDVVRHAAAGLTNAEIGARMFITAGTVKVHLSHIYAKLGVRNRTELARHADQREDR